MKKFLVDKGVYQYSLGGFFNGSLNFMKELSLESIETAASFLEGKIRRTPLEYSQALAAYLKLESMQITGSFKVRGGLFYLSSLSEEQKRRGVACCSAGNHGLGVAFAAKELSVPCTVYVPKNVDKAKHEKMLKLEAQVICSPFDGYDDTLEFAKADVAKNGLHFISAFEDDKIMAANGGTIAREILEDLPDVENVVFPVGGGGLSAGIAFYLKEKAPSVRLIGCQHVHSPALALSLETGKAVTALPPLETIAGGIEGGIGERCFEILKSRIDDVVLVDEGEIEEAFRFVLKHHQLLIEPSAVVTIAAILSGKFVPKGKTVLLLSGRNVSYQTIQRLVVS